MEPRSRVSNSRRTTSVRQALRKKSCNPCREAKTRCNLATPDCSRCEVRGLECIYENMPNTTNSLPNEPRRIPVRQSTSVNTTPTPTPPIELSASTLAAAGQISTVATDATFLPVVSPQGNTLGSPDFQDSDRLQGSMPGSSFDMNLLSSGEYHSILQTSGMDSGSINQDLDFSFMFQETESSSKIISPSSQQLHAEDGTRSRTEISLDELPETVLLSFDKPPTYQSSSRGPLSWNSSAPYLNSRRTPSVALVESTPIADARLLSHREYLSVTSHLNAKVALGILKSYPKMILEGSLPPFLHHCYSACEEGDIFNLHCQREIRFPEALANCKSILQVYFSKTKENSAFVWRMIHSEQRRLRREV